MADITGSFYYSLSEDITTGSILPVEPVTFLYTTEMTTGSLDIVQNTALLFASQYFVISSNEEHPVLYKFRGFNTGSISFEYWTGETQTSPPPSGSPLIDITIVGKL